MVEVPIVFRDRRAGESKMDGAIVAEAIVGVPRLRFGAKNVRRPEQSVEEAESPAGS